MLYERKTGKLVLPRTYRFGINCYISFFSSFLRFGKTPREETDALLATPAGAHTFDLEGRGGTYLENFD
jgi:hypothetical protein